MKEIRDYLEKEVKKHQQRLVEMLHHVGQTVVNDIRTSHISNWDDKSGNLRSSVGYTICIDGVSVETSDFQRVDGPKRGEKPNEPDGSAEGRNFVQSLVPLFPKGIALIVVAGMEYATYVERLQNKTVLAQGELEARKLTAKMIEALNAKLNTKK